MKDLIDRVSTLDFEEYGGGSLASATYQGDSLTLVLDLRVGSATGERGTESWEIVANGLLDHRVSLGSFSHPLLGLGGEPKLVAPYVEPAVELTFNGRPPDAERLLGALYGAHSRWASGWFAFNTFFRGNAELLAGGFGQLAVGPKSLISELAQVLRGQGIKASEVPLSSAFSLAGGTRARPDFIPEAAVFAHNFGNGTDSYVIAREVTARRLDTVPSGAS